MKIKAACVGTPDAVVRALSGKDFSRVVLLAVLGKVLGVSNVLNRPAEFYVQNADEGSSDVMGVEVRLTGASRDGRTSEQFRLALAELVRVTKEAIKDALKPDESCQVFGVIMVDGDVEISPGKYGPNLESKPEWVDGMKNPS